MAPVFVLALVLAAAPPDLSAVGIVLSPRVEARSAATGLAGLEHKDVRHERVCGRQSMRDEVVDILGLK
jgi:hypothetical protein